MRGKNTHEVHMTHVFISAG